MPTHRATVQCLQQAEHTCLCREALKAFPFASCCSFSCQFDTIVSNSGRGNRSWEIASVRLACGGFCRGIFLTDIRGPVTSLSLSLLPPSKLFPASGDCHTIVLYEINVFICHTWQSSGNSWYSWAVSFSKMNSGFTHDITNDRILFCLWPNNIPCCICSTCTSFVRWVQIVPISWLRWI